MVKFNVLRNISRETSLNWNIDGFRTEKDKNTKNKWRYKENHMLENISEILAGNKFKAVASFISMATIIL